MGCRSCGKRRTNTKKVSKPSTRVKVTLKKNGNTKKR